MERVFTRMNYDKIISPHTINSLPGIPSLTTVSGVEWSQATAKNRVPKNECQLTGCDTMTRCWGGREGSIRSCDVIYELLKHLIKFMCCSTVANPRIVATPEYPMISIHPVFECAGSPFLVTYISSPHLPHLFLADSLQFQRLVCNWETIPCVFAIQLDVNDKRLVDGATEERRGDWIEMAFAIITNR